MNILKIAADEESGRAAVVYYKDGKLYVKLLDCSDVIELQFLFTELNETYDKSSFNLNSISDFDIDLNKGFIFLSGRVLGNALFNNFNNQINSHGYLIFNLSGKIIYNLSVPYRIDTHKAQFFDENSIIVFNASDSFMSVYIWNFIDNTFNSHKLHYTTIIEEAFEVGGENWDYEYEYCNLPDYKKDKRLIAYICDGPTYGIQGIRVLDVSKGFTENMLVFEINNLEERLFFRIIFNRSGTGFAIITPKKNSHYEIKEYLFSNLKQPFRTVKYNYNADAYVQYNMDIDYINDDRIAFAFRGRVTVVSMNNGMVTANFSRDMDKPYVVSNSCIYYCRDNNVYLYQHKTKI